MTSEQIKALIEAGLPGAQVSVSGSNGHFEARVVSQDFSGLSRIKRHQRVNATVQAEIASGELHALALRTLTPEESAQA